jgi:hypothetical protein
MSINELWNGGDWQGVNEKYPEKTSRWSDRKAVEMYKRDDSGLRKKSTKVYKFGLRLGSESVEEVQGYSVNSMVLECLVKTEDDVDTASAGTRTILPIYMAFFWPK